MKESRFLIFFLLLILASANLTGEFWIKHLNAGNRQLMYQPKSGAFLALIPEYTIFDISGTIIRQGIFKRGNREWIELQDSTSLDDGSFFSLAYSYDENNEIAGYYKIIRFSWFGDVFFVKGLRLNTNLFQLRYLLQVGDKVKLLGYEDPGNLIGNIVLLNFTKEGELLDFRRSGLNIKTGRFYSSNLALIKTDANHYVVIKTGDSRGNNGLYKSIFLMKFTVDDDLVMIKCYYNPDIWGGQYEALTVKEDPDNGYTLLMLERKEENGTISRIPHLLKFNENWQLCWSRKYQADTQLPWIKNTHLLPGQDSYTIGLSKRVTVNGDDYAHPVLIRTDRNGTVTWSKKYEYAGPQGIYGILGLNNGGMLMTVQNRYFYLLDGSGEVPGHCTAVNDIYIGGSETEFIESPIDDFSLNTSFIPGKTTTDYNGFFYDYDVSENSGGETFCQYLTLQGEFNSVIERSRFSGYQVHIVRFSVDPAIAPYIAKFHVYRKFTGSFSDYEFVSEIARETDKTEYEIEYRPFVLGKTYYNYKIIAYNQKDEIIDYAFLQ